jgi:alpha-glucosidase (family GH31 glycosyl hydrolase)
LACSSTDTDDKYPFDCHGCNEVPAPADSTEAPALRGDAGQAADALRSSDGIDIEIEYAPLAFRLSSGGKPLVALASPGDSALFLLNGKQRLAIACDPAKTTEEGEARRLSCLTEDGRVCNVLIEPREEGAVRIAVSVAGKAESEQIGLALAVGPEEGFYGLMERVRQGIQEYSWEPGLTEGLNLRGQEVNLFVLPTVSVYSPFFVSSAGYGVYVESDWPGTYRFGLDDAKALTIAYEGPSVAVRIFPGPGPLDAVARYSRTVGTTLLPPAWAFGPWRWRDEVGNLPVFFDATACTAPYNSMVVEDVLMMAALGIPCSLYWVDRPWAEGDFGYDDFDWDEDRLPLPLDMVEWLAGKGIKFMLWIAPWAVGEMAEEAVAKGYNVKQEAPWGAPYEAKLIDLTNPEAVAWWQERLVQVLDDGVVGFKLDRGEEKPPDGLIVAGQYHDGTSYREGHNRYPALYAKAVHEAFLQAGLEQFVQLSRCGWVTTSHHGMVWGGDTAGTQWGLRSAIIAAQRAAAMNFPLWGSDTCGYGGMAPHETCARWLAFSAFTPLMEVGPTNNAGLWELDPDGDLVAVWIFYARLHNDLMSYTHEQAKLAHETGFPVIRPLALAYPGVPEYLDLFDEYLYGPDVLAAPVWEEGRTNRAVHIPEGFWLDAWTGETVTGPTLLTDYPVPRHVIPIFIRQGSTLHLGDLSGRWAEAQASAATHPDLSELVAKEAW